MIKSNPVKALWDQGKPAFGTWITLCPHPRVVKIMAAAGFDFLILEMEHTDFSLPQVATLAMLARECGMAPIVRPPGTMKPHDLTRPLDAGAMGLLLPAVESAAQMEEIVRATKYYPRGQRPMNLKGPHTDYRPGDPAETIAHLNAHTLSVVMIESRNAIANLPEILEVDGVDAVMVGPDDLSQDLGVPGQMQHPKLKDAIERIFEHARAKGVAYGVSCHSPEMAADWVAKGARWVPYMNDAAMVMNTAFAAVPKLMEIGGRR